MKKTEVAQLFLIIHNTYPNFSIDEAGIKAALWAEILGDYPFERAKQNLLQHVRRSTFQPTPADLMKPIHDPERPVSILGVTDTALRLQEMDEWSRKATPPPWLPQGSDPDE
ncbi:hypothetical protein J2Z22_001621 [Paenibacillus forsythiae]|uniref:Replicative helicase inhibitor G39P N-terminal domain-containing protein n=1 Tax=Paenibacillus forsythiae TaxID=365616 RepID=A0ABU3H5K4_9BACL|nr:replicative helicase loader/inhibitor [Paenibacillus forsythiae]MDT3426101.1 hypothetical protein [Paenibacillus forsythiae]